MAPPQGDLFGRCPVAAGPGGEASTAPGDWVRCDHSCPLQQYTSNAGLVRHLEALAEQFPHTAKVVEVRAGRGAGAQVGTSGLGQRIVGLRITDDVREERQLLKPMVRRPAGEQSEL